MEKYTKLELIISFDIDINPNEEFVKVKDILKYIQKIKEMKRDSEDLIEELTHKNGPK